MSRERHIHQNNSFSFICSNCGRTVVPSESGGYQRNHCPDCLWSLHVDLRTGDRRCGCRGRMEPITVWVKESGEWAIVHRCISCGFLRTNRIAADDSEQILYALAAKPLKALPFGAEKSMEILNEF